ncbi:hypothetical protein O3P69_006625 [Scylla paramamosain]|uniref:Uncharacterized protein n=1 Tax=Scylla paramamosain TaxID=85552 RepID=A0AAW0U503_SCYPA
MNGEAGSIMLHQSAHAMGLIATNELPCFETPESEAVMITALRCNAENRLAEYFLILCSTHSHLLRFLRH